MIKGAGTALVTPFTKKGNIDKRALITLIETQHGSGIDFIVPCGTTGESPTLNPKEHVEIIEFAVRAVNGKIPVVAGTGSNNTHEAVYLTKQAKKVGANAALVVAPYYNKPMPAGFLDYYREIAKVGLPVILYDIPGRTAKGVPTDVIFKLAHEGSIVGLKWASGDFNQLMEIIAKCPKDFSVLSGDDNLTFPLMALGGHGAISVLSNLFPVVVGNLVRLGRNTNLDKARKLHYALLPVMKAMFIETNPMPVKTALALLHPEVYGANFRSPMMPMEEENVMKLKRILRDNSQFT